MQTIIIYTHKYLFFTPILWKPTLFINIDKNGYENKVVPFSVFLDLSMCYVWSDRLIE